MRRLLALVVLVCVLAAGCAARGEKVDPFAYAKKPLYTGHFDVAEGNDSQMFRVDDGSIGVIRVRVWVNQTAGGSVVDVTDPAGRVAMTTTKSASQDFPLTLGTWIVQIRPQPASAGSVELLVTR